MATTYPSGKALGVAMSNMELEDVLVDTNAKLGSASTSTVGFFGATPVTRPIAALTTVGVASLSTAQTAGLSTAQLTALCANMDAITIGLKALGITA